MRLAALWWCWRSNLFVQCEGNQGWQMRVIVWLMAGGATLGFVLVVACVALRPSSGQAAIPPDALHVRAEGWRQTGGVICQRASYYMPSAWNLLDQYTFLERHGLRRDVDIDRALRRTQSEWQSSTFAVFVGHAWLGLISERATVAIAPNGHPRPQISWDRCVVTEPWRNWL